MTHVDETQAGAETPRQETAKYLQILNGARAVFLSHGYDGASMELIAKTAGVSKGTLYVYFASKEDLFRELILSVRNTQAESFLNCTGTEGSLREVLTRVGLDYLNHMLDPDRLSTIRIVLGATEKFPEFGALLYEAGPKKGMESFGRFLEKRVERGELSCPDPELAACQFVDLCTSRISKRVLFLPREIPGRKELEANVASAVQVFLAAYAIGPTA